jgi:hypothetical protein
MLLSVLDHNGTARDGVRYGRVERDGTGVRAGRVMVQCGS